MKNRLRRSHDPPVAQTPVAQTPVAQTPVAQARSPKAPFASGLSGEREGFNPIALGLTLSEQMRQGALERLREHPIFASPAIVAASDSFDPPGHFASKNDSPTSNARNPDLCEADREQIFNSEMVRIFRGRTQLVAGMGIESLLLFTAFYFFLAPQTSLSVVWVNLALIGLLVLFLSFTPFVNQLSTIRHMALGGYVLFNLGSSAVIALVSTGATAQGQSAYAVQLLVLASFVQILLAILILPFSLREALCGTLVTVLSISAGLHFANPYQTSPIFLAQLFLIVTTSAIILTLCYLNSRQRRQIFDSTFDLALNAARMREISVQDPLTGGANRRYIETVLSAELTRASRFGHPISLVMFDLDNFKVVNDTLGHREGDEVLRFVHHFASSLVREVDTVGRIGGDEFIIILPETDSPSAQQMAHRLLHATSDRLRNHFGPDSPGGRVTLSLGVLSLNSHPLPSADEVLSQVDALLYVAKRDGKNRMVAV